MVANLSAHKRGWDSRWEEFSDWADRGKACHDELLRLVDMDTEAFNGIMAAFGLPSGSDAERSNAIQAATVAAIEVPMRVMEVSLASMEVIKAMAEIGNPASASDAGVGALCARSAVMGAFLNVAINVPSLTDDRVRTDYLERGEALRDQAVAREAEILSIVEGRL
jgi:glutamate formiminotransferase/formiminotetrahydrofolate cyclodeaminase